MPRINITREGCVRLAKGRRCAICGKLGGIGSTIILRMLGYQIPDREIGYAHANCIRKARAASAPQPVKP